LRESGYARARESQFSWAEIGKQFDETLSRVVEPVMA
jgi:hypothetical protein